MSPKQPVYNQGSQTWKFNYTGDDRDVHLHELQINYDKCSWNRAVSLSRAGLYCQWNQGQYLLDCDLLIVIMEPERLYQQ